MGELLQSSWEEGWAFSTSELLGDILLLKTMSLAPNFKPLLLNTAPSFKTKVGHRISIKQDVFLPYYTTSTATCCNTILLLPSVHTGLWTFLNTHKNVHKDFWRKYNHATNESYVYVHIYILNYTYYHQKQICECAKPSSYDVRNLDTSIQVVLSNWKKYLF